MGIADLAHKVLTAWRANTPTPNRPRDASPVSSLVALCRKTHTPFQWEAQNHPGGISPPLCAANTPISRESAEQIQYLQLARPADLSMLGGGAVPAEPPEARRTCLRRAHGGMGCQDGRLDVTISPCKPGSRPLRIAASIPSGTLSGNGARTRSSPGRPSPSAFRKVLLEGATGGLSFGDYPGLPEAMYRLRGQSAVYRRGVR